MGNNQVLYSGEVPNTASLGKQAAFTNATTTAELSGVGVVVQPLNGTVLYVSGSCTLSNSTATDGAAVDIYYKAASAVPAAASAITGYTAYGTTASVISTAANQENVVPLSAVITGLTPGVSYVVTLGAAAVTGGTASMTLNALTVKDYI